MAFLLIEPSLTARCERIFGHVGTSAPSMPSISGGGGCTLITRGDEHGHGAAAHN